MECIHRVCDLLHRLDVIAWDEFVICVKELDTAFFESALGEQQTFYPRETLVWIVIRLFDEREFFTLRLI